MNFEKRKGAPRREAAIDEMSLRFLMCNLIAIILILVTLAVYLTVFMLNIPKDAQNPNLNGSGDKEDYPFKKEGIAIELPSVDTAEYGIPDDLISSEKAILVDITDKKIVASRQGSQIIYPASMTKVMTLIVVVENLKSEDSLDEVLTISHDRGENSGYGFEKGEKLTVRDLIYAAILQSDGVACLTLADYIAGNEATFVQMMNDKAKEMGIGDTTVFQNCTGLHHKYHYSTCRDIAIIMAYAMENPFCSGVLTSIKYSPSDNFRPGEGCTFWNTLLHNRLSDGSIQPNKAEIIGGKTGLTEKDTSGYCIVTYAKGKDNHFYISVTSKAENWDANVNDILKIFNEYIK